MRHSLGEAAPVTEQPTDGVAVSGVATVELLRGQKPRQGFVIPIQQHEALAEHELRMGVLWAMSGAPLCVGQERARVSRRLRHRERGIAKARSCAGNELIPWRVQEPRMHCQANWVA